MPADRDYTGDFMCFWHGVMENIFFKICVPFEKGLDQYLVCKIQFTHFPGIINSILQNDSTLKSVQTLINSNGIRIYMYSQIDVQ
jgi:hypothetical protein